MNDVGFYHLTRTTALDALPQLLGRTLASGQRAMVLCGSAAALPSVSAALWSSRVPDWLPHGGAGDGAGRPEWQPIWLTASPEPSPNRAAFLFLLDGAPHLPGFTRIFDLFDGNDPEQVSRARRRWSEAKAAGNRLTYWQQGEKGWAAKG